MSLNAAPAQTIPTRRIQINHLNELPNDYGTTPGGTMFSTTPGGTRLIYDRKFLLQCRESPLSRTPPTNLPNIPGVTTPDKSPKRELEKVPEQKVPNISPEEASYHAMPEFGWGPWPVYPQFQNFEVGPFISPPPLPNPPTSQLGLYRQRHSQHSPVSPILSVPHFRNDCMPMQQSPVPPIMSLPNFRNDYMPMPPSPFVPPQPMFKDHMLPAVSPNLSNTENDSQLAIWRQTKAEKYFTMAEQLKENNRSNISMDESIFYDQNSNCVVYADEDPSIIACCRTSLHEKDENANFTKLTSH